MKLYMLTRLIVVLLFSILFTVEITGQTPYQTDKIIPASPTSAGLGRYGDIPVSFFNGTPNIQIPLYEIKTPAHSLEVMMRYDASGTRVTQDASWVGLGWTLEAGGAVTRTIRQKDDLDQSRWGYYYAPTLPPSSGHDYIGNWQTDKSFFDNVYDGVYDAEPDIFSYNFCGKSGRFVIGKNADGSSVFLDEKNNLKINYQNGGWIFIDGEGYKYYLNTKETEENYSASLQNELTAFDGLFYLFQDGNGAPASAWYLDSIIAPTNEKIIFTYVKGKSLSLMNSSEQFTKLFQYTYTDCPTPLGDEGHYYNYSRQDITNVYLKKIEFTNGSIEFKLSSRLDVEIGNPQGLLNPSKLDSIIIKNETNVLAKYAFGYGYFNSASAQGRLKLDSIRRISGNGILAPPYKFEYYSPNSLPSKYSKSIDHWGFENSATNTTLLPSTIISESIVSFSGGNRDADESHNYPVKGVLSKMTYPTGGRTEFEYELNDYSNLHSEQAYNTVTKGATGYTNPELFPNDPGKIVNFTIPPYPGETQVPVTIICSYQKTDMNNNNNDVANLGIGTLYLVNGSTTTSKYSCLTGQIDGTNSNEVSYQTTLNLPFGDYRIEMLSWTGWTYKMSVLWPEIEIDSISPLNQRKGGGIRIKSITNYDNIGFKTVKKYSYIGNDGKSSGVLISQPKYDNRFNLSATTVRNVEGVPVSCSFSADYYSIMSSSIYPTSLTSKAGIVGYSKVTEINGENGENGKTEYYYKCYEEAPDEFPDIPSYPNPQNGELDSVLVFNGSNVKLKKTAYTYSFKEMSFLKGVKLFVASTVTAGSYTNRAYRIRYYDNYSYWFVPDQEIDTLFSPSGPITTTKKYYYNNNVHREPSEVDFTKSDGSTLITKYKRPDDYTVAGGNSFVEQMRNMHIVSPVIEQQTLLKQGTTTKLISGTFTSFLKFNNLFFKPSVIYNLETLAPLSDLTESSFATNGELSFHDNYKPKLYFGSYDTYGNLLQQHKNGDIFYSYQWGYNQSLPVVEIVNAGYTPSSDGISTSIIESDFTTSIQRTISLQHKGEIDFSLNPNGLTTGTNYAYTLSGSGYSTSGMACLGIAAPCQSSISFSFKDLNAGDYLLTITASGAPNSDFKNVTLRTSTFMPSSYLPEFFYNNFETITANQITSNAYTGRLSYNNSSVKYTVPFTIPNTKQYIIEYHYRDNGKWYPIKKSYINNMLISEGDAIDEVRVYPSDAQMTTYTYDPLIGMTSNTNVTNQRTTYEYDGFGRLSVIRDQNGAVEKIYNYSY